MRGTVSSCSLAMVVINSRSKRCCSPFRATTYRHSKQSQVMEMPTQNAYHSHEQSLKSWSCCIKHFLRRFVFRHFRSPTWELSREFTNSRCWTFNVWVSSSCAAMFKEPVFSGVENSTRSVDSWFLFPLKLWGIVDKETTNFSKVIKEGRLWELRLAIVNWGLWLRQNNNSKSECMDRRAYETRTCNMLSITL